MQFSRFRLNEITPGRVLAALWRRALEVPHSLAWNMGGPIVRANHERIKTCKGRHAEERCFILGNGPSLRLMDLSPLANEITFGLNRINLLFEEMGYETTYYVCMNELVLEQTAGSISKITSPKFLNWNRRQLFSDDPSIKYLKQSFRKHFSRDLTKGIWFGSTVTFAAIEIAYYMGFSNVFLIGVDHAYAKRDTPHKVVVADGDDPNHFEAEYFPTGFRWQIPDLTTSEIAFQMAKEAFETEGREILDATVGGRLEVFQKSDYWDILRKKRS